MFGTGVIITWTPDNNSAYKTNGNEANNRRWYPVGMATRSSDSTNGSRLYFNFGWIGIGVAGHGDYQLSGFRYELPTGFNRMARNLLPEQTAFSPKHSNHPSGSILELQHIVVMVLPIIANQLRQLVNQIWFGLKVRKHCIFLESIYPNTKIWK